ncbi:MAG: GNAT family N-acetyltransferase [Acidobacteriota bacterium]
MSDLERALARVPEAPAHVIPRGMLLRATPALLGSVARGSFGIHDARRATLALIGDPPPTDCLPTPVPRVAFAVSERFDPQAWPIFRWETLDVFISDDRHRAPPAVDVELLASTFPVADASADLRFALEIGLALGPVFAARSVGNVVAAACCFWRSERYFDISIDTLPAHRHRGLGYAVAVALLNALRPARAVHCSSPDETRARDFIRALGFRRVGAIWRGVPDVKPSSMNGPASESG